MNGNIVGEEFEDYVFDQISQRQTNQYAGYETPRTPEQIQYLNNTTAWVKLASGVKIDESNGGLDRLRTILNGDSENGFKGTELAKSTVLFNGLSETDPATYKDGKKVEKLAEYNFRSGYSKTNTIWNSTSAYGLGGPEFGQQPMPGIQSVNVKSLNRGSIREANVKIKAYNKIQFAIIEFLYLRIGFSMMLEWGNDKFINNKGEFQPTGNTIIEDLWFDDNGYTQLSMIDAIERYRNIYSGNYDGFFGKVVNFTWTFGADGSYDIDLKLITVGDIIESLQANIPVNSSEVSTIDSQVSSSVKDTGVYQNLAESSIVNAAQNNKIGKYLFTSIGDKTLWDDSNPEYFSLKEQNISTSNRRGRNSNNFQLDQKINDKYNYFMTFGELLYIFKNNCIPGIETSKGIEPLLNMESDENSNKISYYPNQTSLDPRICIFNYVFGSIGEENPKYSISGIKSPPYLKTLKEYIGVEGTDVIYGKLMNIYLNYDFISKCLISNTKDGKLSMFKFFQKICDGINSSLGGVNNIEPVIKNDKIVTFIDQNPIPGYLELIGKDKTVVDLEVYGYNQSKKSSNFVKDISFKTEITPQLASMITIGGGGGENEDGTAFSYWNEGLIDRFQPKINETKDKVTPQEKLKKDRVEYLINYFNSNSSWNAFSSTDSSDPTGKTYPNKFGGERRNIRLDVIRGVYSCKQFIKQVLDNDAYLKKYKNLISQSQLAGEKQNNYAAYLAEAFGGSTGIVVQSREERRRSSSKTKIINKTLQPIPLSKAKYTLFDSKFISRAKSTYTVYINSMMRAQFDSDGKDKSPSNQIGFIPVGFGVQLQGISGVKIYNKLNINNTFLPSQYPKALKFLVKSVSHTIENNTWTTSLDTLSIPKVRKTPRKGAQKFIDAYQVQIGGTPLVPFDQQGPEVPKDSTKSYMIGEIRYKGKYYNYDEASKFMNIDAQPTFRAFFKDFVKNWRGYTMQINAIDRSIAKSLGLNTFNSQNAEPGYSKHNYSAAIDCNIITPSNYMLPKKGMKNGWINHGFRKLAETHNIEWGGNFGTYEDCVHFAYNFNINKAVANATEVYGSVYNLPSSKGKEIKLT